MPLTGKTLRYYWVAISNSVASGRHFRETGEDSWGNCHSSLFCWRGTNGAHIVVDRLHLLYPIKWHVGVHGGRCSDSMNRQIGPTLTQPKAVPALSYNLAQARTSPSEHAIHLAPRTAIGFRVPPCNPRYLTCVHDYGGAVRPPE